MNVRPRAGAQPDHRSSEHRTRDVPHARPTVQFSRSGRRAPRPIRLPAWGPQKGSLQGGRLAVGLSKLSSMRRQECIGHECRMLRMDIHLTTPDSVDMLRAPAGIGMARCSPDQRSGRAPRPAGQTDSVRSLPRKEVIQPHLPVRLPCYDFTPITSPTFDGSLPKVGSPASGVARFRGVTGGVYMARERIHRGIADPRLLATPASWRRVSASNPNRDRLYGIRSTSRYRNPLYRPM